VPFFAVIVGSVPFLLVFDAAVGEVALAEEF
jgi:hypothetical protein